MIFEAVISALVVGVIRRGRVLNFAYLDIKWIYLFMFGALGQALLFNFLDGQGSGFALFLFDYFYYIHIATYGLILIPLVLNVHWWGFRWMALGTFMNLIPIATNGGKMPVLVPEGYQKIFDAGHALLVDSTHFKWLSDLFFIGPPYPWPKVLSIGDVFLVIGVFWFIQVVMTQSIEKTKAT